MDWRNWVIGILVTWVTASFVLGRRTGKLESEFEQYKLRVVNLEQNVNVLLGVRIDVASIRGAMDTANKESSRLTGMIQTLIGDISELKELAVKLETWVCDLRDGRGNGSAMDKRLG